MVSSENKLNKKAFLKDILKRNVRFRSSIYGQVVYTITLLSIILFVLFGIIFRSVYENYLNTIIMQNGNNIGSVVEGALYYSMLKNDRSALQNTIDVINTMPGIEDVNMYDSKNRLVYSSYLSNTEGHSNPECLDCHENISSMFPEKKKSFKIISLNSECKMSPKNYDYRLLLIRSPILNQPSCYTASCHAHSQQDAVLGSIVIRIPLDALDSAVKTSSTDFFILASISTLLLMIFLLFFTRRKIKNPLYQIIQASEAVSQGDKSKRLTIEPKQLYDMKLVATAFNEMLDNLQTANDELQNWSQQLEYKVQKKSAEITEMQKELIHVERIASLGKLSASVAHEINNPLSGVLTYTKLVNKQLRKTDLDEETKEPMLKYLQVIEDETKRCGDIVKNLLEFSRKDQQDFENKHLHKILSETYALLEHQMKISNIRFLSDFTASWDLINCNENQIKQACIAILLNASEAVNENGEIIIRTSTGNNEHIKIEIIDNGVGIPPEDIPHVFEPFFSAKGKVSGIGLGLAIVHGIVQSHNGKVEITSEMGIRTILTITLPLVKN